MKAICDKCTYEWETKSQLITVSCPSCCSKVKIRTKEGENYEATEEQTR